MTPRRAASLRPGQLKHLIRVASVIKHGSSHSGRRTLAAKVLAATGDVDTVQTIDHSHLDQAKLYLSVCQVRSGSDRYYRRLFHSPNYY